MNLNLNVNGQSVRDSFLNLCDVESISVYEMDEHNYGILIVTSSKSEYAIQSIEDIDDAYEIVSELEDAIFGKDGYKILGIEEFTRIKEFCTNIISSRK